MYKYFFFRLLQIQPDMFSAYALGECILKDELASLLHIHADMDIN